MHSNYRSLAFLLSIGGLPLACTNDGNDSDTDSSTGKPNTATDTGDTTTDPTSSTTSSDPTTTTTGDALTSSTTGTDDTGTTTPGSTTFITSESDSDTGEDTEGDTEDLPTDPICLAYAAHFVECVPRYVDYRVYAAQYCEVTKENGLMLDGQPCVDALDAVSVCLSSVDCADFLDENPPGCEAELMARDLACPNLFEESPDTDTGEDTGDSSG